MALFKNSYERKLMITGYVITQTVLIERLIDDCLANYFCSRNRRNRFKETLLFTERLSFDHKKEVLTLIIKEEYKDFLKQHPTILQNLNDVAPHRNIFAHLEFIETESISFKRYKGGKLKIEAYASSELGKLEIMFDNIQHQLNVLKQVISPRKQKAAGI